MFELFSYVILAPLGWICLRIRYWNSEKIEAVLISRYEGWYSIAGLMIIGKFTGIIITVAIIFVLIFFLFLLVDSNFKILY